MTAAPTRFRGHYETAGSGPPVLCLAGFGCDHWIFEDLIDDLGAHYRLIMPHNRGMGQSPPASAPYTIEDLAADALALMDDLGHDRFHVLGVSMGGFIALALARVAAPRIERLMLLCATAAGPDFVPLPVVPEDVLAESYNLAPETAAAQTTERTVHPDLAVRAPHVHARILARRAARRPALDQLLLQVRAVEAYLAVPTPLHHLTMPTLVLTGDDDHIVDPRNTAVLARAIPGAEAVVVPGTNHLFFIEKADVVHAHLRRFLEAS